MLLDDITITVDVEDIFNLVLEDLPETEIIVDDSPDVILLASGNLGAQGPQGERGIMGPEGPMGPQGVEGPEGEQGVQGVIGATGATGATGPQGPKGDPGSSASAFEYSLSTSNSPPPNTGEISSNATGAVESTLLCINYTPVGMGAIKPLLLSITEDDEITVQDKTDVTKYATWKVVGPVTDVPAQNYVSVPVQHIFGTPIGKNNQSVMVFHTLVGAVGPQGPQGPVGETGPQGPQGIQGIQGEIGSQGPTGAQGPQGVKGDTGATGSQGPQGIQGDTGATGPQGNPGPQGVKGDTGSTGPQGPVGPEGPPGPEGPEGPIGPEGGADLEYFGAFPTGTPYEDGDVVIHNGVPYLCVRPTSAAPVPWSIPGGGLTGPQGPVGPEGPQGPAGTTGQQGPPGETGQTGQQGIPGTPGEKWWSGIGAPPGANGIIGDWYLDTATGDIYEKTGTSTWTSRGNIKGPTGSQGTAGVVKPFLTGHTFALSGDVSGYGTLPGFFIPKAATEVVELVGIRAKIASGTSVGVQVKCNGTNVGGVITVTPTAAYTALGPVTLADGDELTLALSSPVGTPTSLGATMTVRVTPS